MTKLHNAAQAGNLAEVKRLLNAGANINSKAIGENRNEATPLIVAALNGKLNVVRELLKRGAKVNIKSNQGKATALHEASGAGHLNIVKELLAHKASFNTRDFMGRTPLHAAVACRQPNVVRALVKAGAAPNTENYSFQAKRYPAYNSTHNVLFRESFFNPKMTKLLRNALTTPVTFHQLAMRQTGVRPRSRSSRPN